MSDSADPQQPRVEVQLPDRRTVPGRLHRRRQGGDGQWWAQVLVQVPAAAIRKVAGQDYSGVPREPAGAHARYVMEVDERRPNSGAIIHDATSCFTLDESASWARLTPLTADQARGQLRFDGTTACTVCNPKP